MNGAMTGPPLKLSPKWKKELRILRRTKNPVKYVRSYLALRRFHKSVDAMEREEGRAS